MNIKEIFEKAENGTLTLEQFEAIAKEGGAKFTDLSEGKYVSKSKYDDDLKAKDTSITEYTDTIAQRDKDLADLQTKLKDAGTDSTKLAELQASFDSLQNKYTADTEAYQQKLADQQYEFAVKEFASGKKFTSNAAKRDFTNAMIGAKLTMKGEKIIGADDFVSSYSEENADAFVAETEPSEQSQPAQPKPHFVAPTSNQTAPSTEGQSTGLFHFNFTDVRGTNK